MIIKNAGPNQNINFKYVVFRGEAVINEYNTGTSTIVGQANSHGAMTVGAVLYSNTPAYGVNPANHCFIFFYRRNACKWSSKKQA